MSELLRLQQLFARLLPRLLDQAHRAGFEVTIGEVYRPDYVAEMNALSGAGIRNSLHCVRLAVDLHLFRDGTYLTQTADHAELGAWWKTQHPLCRWGGDFKRADGNHYSISYGGRA